MKHCARFLAFVLVITIISSCEKDITPVIELTQTAINLPTNESSAEVSFTANTNWTATISGTWCTISPSNGKGDATITISASDNFSSRARSAVLKIVSQDLIKEVTVSQDYAQLSTSVLELSFPKNASTQQLTITSNTKWIIELPLNLVWVTVGTLSGEGNATVNVSVNDNASGPARSSYITIKYGNESKIITISQARSQNSLPSLPQLTSPVSNATNVATLTNFVWTASSDADGDNVSYTLSYTKDNTNWKDTTVTVTSVYLPSHLEENTRYSWRVTANDGIESVTTATSSFTTGSKRGLAEREYSIALDATEPGSGGKAADIIFVGDGYTAADFQEGGKFHLDVQEGINGLFNVEPYKTYKSHFRVYKIGSYSKESGVTQSDKSIVKNTVFSSSFNGGSSITTNFDKVFEYCKTIPSITTDALKATLVIVLLNQDRYAGTTYIWTDGSVMSLTPVARSYPAGSQYVNILVHEAGGHGFGGLADEYITNQGQTITSSAISDYNQWNALGFFANIDIVSDLTTVKWKHFIGLEGYSRVGVYEGAFGFSYGVWRAENTSCMIDNILYFSAPSREAIVKRIMTRTGNIYSFESFRANDVERAPSSAAAATYSKGFNNITFQPLSPPILLKK